MARRNLGMKLVDDRWTPTDQLIQTKGVVEFNERNKKWLQMKQKLERKLEEDKIRKLQKSVKRLRELVKKLQSGYADSMDEVLAKDKEVHLICRKKSPEVICDNLKHMIFRRRKAIDNIKCDIKNSKQELFQVELDIASTNDKVNAGNECIRDQESEENEYYTAQLESVKTQNDTCKIVMECYQKIIGVLKKDSLYFDAVVNSLEEDASVQSQTILKIIELGQLGSKDYSWLKQETKKSIVKLNDTINDHRQKIKECAVDIQKLELMNIKLNEYGAKAYPMFQEEDIDPGEDLEAKEIKEQFDEIEGMFRQVEQTLGVDTIHEVFPQLEKIKSDVNKLNKLADKFRPEYELLKKENYKSQALAEHFEHFFPEELKSAVEENETIKVELETEAEDLQSIISLQDKIKQDIETDKLYYLKLKRLLWSVDIGQPSNNQLTIPTRSDKKNDSSKDNKDDPFELFQYDRKPANPTPTGSDDEESECKDNHVPFNLIDLVCMKAKILHDSIGDKGTEEECDPKILEAFGAKLSKEQDFFEEEMRKTFAGEKTFIKPFKPKFNVHRSGNCEHKSRLEVKFISRQLIVQKERAREKEGIRFHLHPKGVYRGMYIEKGSSESEPEAVAKKRRPGAKEEDHEVLSEEESDIGYEESEEEEPDSDVDPNEPKPHICY